MLPSSSCSACPLERSIGEFKKFIKSKSNASASAVNILDCISMFNTFKQFDSLNRSDIATQTAHVYSDPTFIKSPSANTQLWSTISSFSFTDYPTFYITPDQFCRFLQGFHKRVLKKNYTPSPNEPFIPAEQIRFNDKQIHGFELHRIKKNETRRSNHFVWFVE